MKEQTPRKMVGIVSVDSQNPYHQSRKNNRTFQTH